MAPTKIPENTVLMPILGGIGFKRSRPAYSWKTFLLQRLVNLRPGIFADVGVNLGQTLIDLRLVHPDKEYLGFEPNPECVNYVNTLIRINRYSTCTVVACGLSDKMGVVTLYLHRGKTTDDCATILKDLRPGRRFDIKYVPVLKFDEIKDTFGSKPIGFIKIDVEGAELEVLSGMRRKIILDRPLILCEVLFTDKKADLADTKARNEMLMNLLSECDYTAWQLLKSGDQVTKVKKIETFESAYWTPFNANLCDYLFIPQEHQQAVL
ncbi:MAG: FkbM family methyltransferase, partial [Candidatus Bipolaricaulia bacterium]